MGCVVEVHGAVVPRIQVPDHHVGEDPEDFQTDGTRVTIQVREFSQW